MLKFYRCKHCGNLIVMVDDKMVNPVCCGEKMEMLVPGAIEASTEKHIPVCVVDNGRVKVEVGSIIHPMQDVHYIEWIAMETNKGFAIHYLKPGEEPKTEFVLVEGEEVKAIYSYCNLHGLWVK
ncbi:MAG: desulfoferrodoxin [Bacilli bacterium]|nr:desulfoferrodoxin [Bacilli bacterium]